jgi:hypothetical protein
LVLDLGPQPVGVLAPEDAAEALWPLRLQLCRACWLLQLADGPPERAEDAELAGLSRTSDTLREDAMAALDELATVADLEPGARVLELASHGNHLDIELEARRLDARIMEANPVVARRLREGGVEVIETLSSATRPTNTGSAWRPKAILDHFHAAHASRLDTYLGDLADVLDPDGVIGFELDHALSTVTEGQFDAVRHGHFTYLSLTSFVPALERHDLHVVDAVRTPSFGGALRVYARRTGHDIRSARVDAVLAEEATAGLAAAAPYEQFASLATRRAKELRGFLEAARAEGRRVVGYGAPSRATTLLMMAGIGTDLLPMLVDRSPAKHGRRLAGTGIPIEPVDAVAARRPDFLLVLTWNLMDEVIGQMASIRTWGGRFVRPLPQLEIVA